MVTEFVPALIQTVFNISGNDDVFELLAPADASFEMIHDVISDIQKGLRSSTGAVCLKPGWAMGVLGEARVIYIDTTQGDENGTDEENQHAAEA